jgi:hypothetical protein
VGRTHKRALAEIRLADISVIQPEAIASREAFDLAAAGQTSLAADRLQQVINDLEDPALRGWLMEQKAAYLHFTDRAAAQQVLRAAVRENNFVLRPEAGIAPASIRTAAVQARAAADFLATEYSDAMTLVLGVRACSMTSPGTTSAWTMQSAHGNGSDSTWGSQVPGLTSTRAPGQTVSGCSARARWR